VAADDSFEGRIDYLELLISTLRDHEKQLNDVADTLVESVNEIRATVEEGVPTATGKPVLTVRCEQWSEFKRRGAKARLVTFSLREHRLTVHAVADEVYAYAEPLPAQELHVRRDGESFVVDGLTFGSLDRVPLAFRQRLDCGLDGTFVTSRHAVTDGAYRVQMRFTLDPTQVRRWLAEELKVPSDGIVEGSIAH
jgi:hypothetical protein